MTTEQINTSKQIRQVGIAEGISYIILLFIAMPLKYFAGMPLAVKTVGWLHGVLFMAFMWMIWKGKSELGWPNPKAVTAFVASLLPFGTFWLDKKLKQDEQ